MISFPDFKYKQLIIYFSSKQKCKLKFKADNLVIEDENGKTELQHSCHRTFALFIIGNITITSPLLERARKFGFPVIIMNRNFKIITYFNNRAEGNFMLRQKQYQISSDKKFQIASEIVKQKINNQIRLLELLRYKAADEKNAIIEIRKILDSDFSSSKHLLGIEGSAAKIFFSVYFRQMNWIRREPRTKSDINNLLLDIGYTYLFNFIEAIISLFGFDVYCGVYHTFFYQRKSLVCDFMEPFRCIIDKRLRKSWNLGQIDTKDFFQHNGVYSLAYKNQKKYTKFFVKDILNHKDDIFLYFQRYYRWFMKEKTMNEFPSFKID